MPETQHPTPTGQSSTDRVPEWRIVPTKLHPEPDISEPYPCAPGPSDGLTKQTARELAHGRNRAGEPSPVVTWSAEPTGQTKPRDDLQ